MMGSRDVLAEEAAHGPRPEDHRDVVVAPELRDIRLPLLCNLVNLHWAV